MVIILKNISIWKDSIKRIKYPELNENKNVDVLIIGGGITGASTYYHLKNSHLKIILVDQNKIGFSITGNSTGKLNYLQNDLIDKIRKNFNDEIAYNYIKSQIDAIKIIVDIINKEQIDCDLVKVKNGLYTNNDKEVTKLKNLEKFLKNNNIDVNSSTTNLVKTKYMIEVDNTYIFHPIKFIYGLLKNLDNIYENTSIKKIDFIDDYYICKTDKYEIKTKYVVLASHYPYFNIPYLFPIKGSLEKSYLSASTYNTKSISFISYSYPFISVRNYKNYLIYISNTHSIDKDINDTKHFDELRKQLKNLKLKPEYLWSNIDIITNDGLPYIGKIKDKLLISTGYNTWGLTNGFLGGKILSDIILNKTNQYSSLFNPKRINLSQILGNTSDIIKNINGLIQGSLYKNNQIISKKIGNKKVMIYNHHTVIDKCPHFGCKLVFNETEKTWDCPCHGSRFDIDGKCISSPSNHDITFKNL